MCFGTQPLGPFWIISHLSTDSSDVFNATKSSRSNLVRIVKWSVP